MGEIITNHYMITNPRITEDKEIAYLSDVHSDIAKLKAAVEELKKLNIRILLLGGDLVDSTKDYKSKARIKEILQELSNTMKIYIGMGNHECLHYTKDVEGVRSEVKSKDIKYWNELSSMHNIYVSELPLDGSTVTKWYFDRDLDITALNFPIDFYLDNEKRKDFLKQLRVMDDSIINKKKYNILLCHTPRNLVRNGIICEDIDCLNGFNLILSGHMHAGLVPKLLRSNRYGVGFVGPHASVLPEYAYGLVVNKRIATLTSGGITKVTKSASPDASRVINRAFVKNKLNSIYSPEVEILKLTNGNRNTIKKLKRD